MKMKKVLSGILASSLMLSMGMVSHASDIDSRLDNIFGMIELVQDLNGDENSNEEDCAEENAQDCFDETIEITPDENADETPVPESTYLPDNDPTPKVAEPSTARVMVNGESVPFSAYLIDGFNYFKLTDVSYALSGTSRQFQVTWDADIGAINMITERPHLVLGTEMQGNSGQEETALRFFSPVYKNGEEMVVTVYTIDGSSYFKLDSLMVALDLNVGWDGETGTITITA